MTKQTQCDKCKKLYSPRKYIVEEWPTFGSISSFIEFYDICLDCFKGLELTKVSTESLSAYYDERSKRLSSA